VLAANQSIEFKLEFIEIPETTDSMALVMSNGIRINGIKIIE
jgi:hypothetical protein